MADSNYTTEYAVIMLGTLEGSACADLYDDLPGHANTRDCVLSCHPLDAADFHDLSTDDLRFMLGRLQSLNLMRALNATCGHDRDREVSARNVTIQRLEIIIDDHERGTKKEAEGFTPFGCREYGGQVYSFVDSRGVQLDTSTTLPIVHSSAREDATILPAHFDLRQILGPSTDCKTSYKPMPVAFPTFGADDTDGSIDTCSPSKSQHHCSSPHARYLRDSRRDTIDDVQDTETVVANVRASRAERPSGSLTSNGQDSRTPDRMSDRKGLERDLNEGKKRQQRKLRKHNERKLDEDRQAMLVYDKKLTKTAGDTAWQLAKCTQTMEGEAQTVNFEANNGTSADSGDAGDEHLMSGGLGPAKRRLASKGDRE